MAIVANLADNGGPIPGYSAAVDRPYTTPNRKLAASPVAVTTPAYAGEIVLDQASGQLWKAEGLTNADWTPFLADVAHG